MGSVELVETFPTSIGSTGVRPTWLATVVAARVRRLYTGEDAARHGSWAYEECDETASSMDI